MTLVLDPSVVDWILAKMESITKDVMTNSSVWTPEMIVKRIGEFTAFSEILANSGFESYGLKFQIKYPTLREYEHVQAKAEGWD